MAGRFLALLLPLLLLLRLPSISTENYPPFIFRVRENSLKGTRVGSLLTYADGPSGITLSKLQKTGPPVLIHSYCVDKFRIDANTGYVIVKGELDRENLCPHSDRCPCEMDQILSDNSIAKIKIEILDENDHAPAFSVPVKAITISESAQVGYEHSLDPAIDPDRFPNNVKQYSIHVKDDVFSLEYNHESGELKLRLEKPLDRETTAQYNATIDACDGAPNRKCSAQKLIVSVKDENDNSPVFEQENYEVHVNETTTMGTNLVQIVAHDADEGENGRVRYSMRANQLALLGQTFHVDDTSGIVYLKTSLNFKDKARYDIFIDATDSGATPRKKTTTLVVKVIDVNDHPPKIKIQRINGDRVQIRENLDSADPVAHLLVNDNDDPNSDGGKFSCKLTKGNDYFRLDKIMGSTGGQINFALQPIRRFDRESTIHYVTHINCQDQGKPPLGAREDVTVYIVDENEFQPTFGGHNFTRSVPENRTVGDFVMRVTAKDDDADAVLRYKLDRDGQQYFKIDPRNGDIRTAVVLNREDVSVINFGVLVTDAESGLVHTASTSVRVNVLDINDNAPSVIGKRRFSIEENIGEARLGQLRATDPDAGDNGQVVFRLRRVRNAKNEPISIDLFKLSPDGELEVRQSLDRELVSQYLLDIEVHDQGQPRKTSSSTITVDVVDQNDNWPVWTHPMNNRTQVNITDAVKPGTVITRVHAKDDDVQQNITYHLKDDARGHFHVSIISGKLWVSSLLKPGIYPLVLVASDNGQPVNTRTISYIVNVVAHSEATFGSSRSPMNFTLVVGMIAATCVISISLLIAIFLVRRRTLRTRMPKSIMVSWQQDEPMYPANGSVYPLSSQTYYPTTPMTSFGQSEKAHSTIRALPTDMEVASADSGHGASEEENGQQAALGVGSISGSGSDLKMMRGDYRPHIGNSRACPILPEDSVIQCGCGDTIDLAGNTIHPRASNLSASSHHSVGCAMGAGPMTSGPLTSPPAYHLTTSSANGGTATPFRTFPRVPRPTLAEGSGSIDGSLSRLCHSPQTNV